MTHKGGKKITFKKLMKWLGIAILVYIVGSVLLTALYIVVNPPVTFLMVQRYVEQTFDKEREAKIDKHWVKFEDISPNMVRVVMASEDQNFPIHDGFDRKAIEKEKKRAERTGKRHRGASTISQQTAKNVFLWPQRSYIRKGLEVYQTVLIEKFWSKRRIMEVYLNVIEFGDGIYGVEAASQHYFGKSAKHLSSNQAARLASILPNPLRYDPVHPSRYLRKHIAWIEKNMRRMRNASLNQH